MAAQYLGRSASSAGVERMFSKAGKLHDDLKKRQVDDTLEHSIFAAANTRRTGLLVHVCTVLARRLEKAVNCG